MREMDVKTAESRLRRIRDKEQAFNVDCQEDAIAMWRICTAYLDEKPIAIYRITDSSGRLVGVRIGEQTWKCKPLYRGYLQKQQRSMMNAVFDYITKECPEDDGPESQIIREEWDQPANTDNT